MKDLKECPFCGSVPVESHNFGRYAITCHECGVSIRSEEVCGEGTVKERWNHRPEQGWVKVSAIKEVAEKFVKFKDGWDGAASEGMSVEDAVDLAKDVEALMPHIATLEYILSELTLAPEEE